MKCARFGPDEKELVSMMSKKQRRTFHLIEELFPEAWITAYNTDNVGSEDPEESKFGLGVEITLREKGEPRVVLLHADGELLFPGA